MEKQKDNKVILTPVIYAKKVFIQNATATMSNLKITPKPIKEYSIFNKQFQVLSSLGEGNTSKVYLCQDIKNPKKKIALKILKKEFLDQDEKNVKAVEQEIQILIAMRHQNIINILGFGSEGNVVKPSGREINKIVYIQMQYVPGGLLFDFCKQMGPMGEDTGRFFMNQLVDALQYMHDKGVAHRDLKLENILMDNNFNLKIADFGFATYKKIEMLKSYRGTQSYMAPEIREGKIYNGNEIDMFSAGVVLFIIVMGIFPFKQAKKSDCFYKLFLKGEYNLYWKKIGGENLSDEFKDLIVKLFDNEGKQRPKIDDFKKHPWMLEPYNSKLIKDKLMIKYTEKSVNKTVSTASREQSKQ